MTGARRTPRTRQTSRAALVVAIGCLLAGGLALAGPRALAAPNDPARSAQALTPPTSTGAPMPRPPTGAAATASPAAAIASARALSEAFTTVADQVSASVVAIRVEAARPAAAPIPFFGGDPSDSGIARGTGSGFVISRDGHILTNNHVVQGATRIDVLLHDGRTHRARMIGADPASDIAVLKIDASDLAPLRFGDSEQARVGEWVVAIGSPFGLNYTVTTGVVSGMGRGGLGANEIEDYLQTDASINPGNSGGPLVNLDGEVLGVNTMIIGRGSGISFAVPASIARRVADQLIRTGEVRRAWIGVGFQELTAELAAHFGAASQRGALVSTVAGDGPAARAGLRPGDVVTAVADQPVESGHDLLRAVIRHDVGAAVALRVLRDGRSMTMSVTTGERPTDRAERRTPGRNGITPRQDPSGVGLSLRTLDDMIRRQLQYAGPGRVVIDRVAPGSPAERAGLETGDVVVEIDRRPVTSPSQVLDALRDGNALVRVDRRGGSFFAALNRAN